MVQNTSDTHKKSDKTKKNRHIPTKVRCVNKAL